MKLWTNRNLSLSLSLSLSLFGASFSYVRLTRINLGKSRKEEGNALFTLADSLFPMSMMRSRQSSDISSIEYRERDSQRDCMGRRVGARN